MTLQCIIIDDEPIARTGLKEYIQDTAFLQLAGEFDNPMKAIDTLQQQKIDLIFLDIQMPRMTGLEFLKTLSHPPLVIFTTAYPNYAVEGFELNAVDYLLKPFSFERFWKAATKAKAQCEAAAQPATPAGAEPDYFFIKSDSKLIKIKYDEILFVEALQNYVAVYTTDKKYITYLTFRSIEEYLPASRFVRTHKSFIVAAAKVESIEGNDIRIGQHHIPISRTEREAVLQQLLQNRLLKR
ncbi:LytTR family DNA-binding domain-containing protein [Paraflavitalea sp. CAU 1676]|uniref:LytR/AlgR family response regulator transcription factor n=1 Tax=Paraflavitalea sp. CAU 1676 TaxID=3032598 RepID=UPI0023D9CDAD|nr:LytTR family DNA-binding domain-containing protein [Paraflavitalea sp. CAU 1676]MDF2188149.1 LytTR family DNA-binding domain-containing protein [Paraflavitalea sp. CAU 1676]